MFDKSLGDFDFWYTNKYGNLSRQNYGKMISSCPRPTFMCSQNKDLQVSDLALNDSMSILGCSQMNLKNR